VKLGDLWQRVVGNHLKYTPFWSLIGWSTFHSGDLSQALSWQHKRRYRRWPCWSKSEMGYWIIHLWLCNCAPWWFVAHERWSIEPRAAETVNNVVYDAMWDLRIQQQADPEITQLREWPWMEQGRKLRSPSVKNEGRELRNCMISMTQHNSIAFRSSIVWNLHTPDLAKTSNVKSYTRMASKSDKLRNLDSQAGSPQTMRRNNNDKFLYYWDDFLFTFIP